MFFFRCRQNDVAAIDINMGCPKTFSLSVCKANKTSTDIFMCALCFSMKAKNKQVEVNCTKSDFLNQSKKTYKAAVFFQTGRLAHF